MIEPSAALARTNRSRTTTTTSSAAFLTSCQLATRSERRDRASALMAGSRVQPPSLELGVRVVRVEGLEQEQLERGGGGLFLRYYVPAGGGDGRRRRLRVDTREVPCGGDLLWGELARFERWGGGGGAAWSAPAAAPIAFELRWRPRPSASGLAALLEAGARARPSRVLARAELPWADVASSSQPAERWLTLSPVGRELAGCKAPRLLVEVEAVHAVAGDQVAERAPRGMTECCRAGERCGQCGWVGIGSEEDMFLAATFS